MEDTEQQVDTENVSGIMRLENRIGSLLPNSINWNVILIVYAVILIALNFSRLFYNNFWGDECYDIMLTRGTYENLMYMTEYHDNHPPLHYLYVKFMCDLLGQEPFVYNLTSFIPYLLLMIITLTFVRKHMGADAAAIVITFMSILETSLYYITEMRQYQLAMFFIFIVFLLFYKLLKEPSVKYFIFLTIMYIAACYTHYYVLMAGGLMYVAYGIKCLIHKEMVPFKYALISLIVSILAFLPWMQFFLTEASDLSEHFWLEGIPSLSGCIMWFFGYNYIWILFYFGLFLIVLYILFRFNVLKNKDNLAGKLISFFDLGEHKWAISIIGVASIFLVIIGMYIMSTINTPVLSCRYVYPFSAIIWVIFAMIVVGCKARKTAFVIVIAIILAFGIPNCYIWMTDEYNENETIKTTLDITYPLMNDDDYLVSDVLMFAGNECLYYYGIECNLYYNHDEIIDHLTTEHQNWLFLRNMMDEGMSKRISDMGYKCDLIMEDGRLGSEVLQIYRVTM